MCESPWKFFAVLTVVAAAVWLSPASVCRAGAEEKIAAGNAIVRLDGKKLTADSCTIVLAKTAAPCEVHASKELQKYLYRITGVDLPVKSDDEKIGQPMILVGKSKKLEELGVAIDFADLGEEGFVIKTVGPHLVLAGGRERGTLYSVYTLLEEYLGCGWFMPTKSLGEVVPTEGVFSLGAIDRKEKPSFEWRSISGMPNGQWLVNNKLDPTLSGSGFGPDKGDPAVFGSRGHSFDRLLPPGKYFISHPEYFAMVDGKRQWDGAQICTSNPEVIKICAEALIEQMDKRPDCKIFSLCQDDGFGWCECEKCKALDVEENIATDRLMRFANAVGELVAKKHPDKRIYTYAYTAKTQSPPRTKDLKPASNLMIELTHYSPCCHSHPVATCERNKGFKSQVEGWSKIAHTLYVYDYRPDFSHYLMPYPNCYAIAKDIPYYRQHKVKGLYYQGDGWAMNHGPCHYLIAKLMWNAGADVDALIDRFFDRYYGPAGPPMKAWFRLLHDRMWNENICFHLYSRPEPRLFTVELLKKGDALFDEAQRLAGNRTIRDRVRRERITLYYVKLVTGRSAEAIKKQTGCYHGSDRDASRTWESDLANFIRLTEEHGVTQVRESFGSGVKFTQDFVELVLGMTVHDKAEYRWLSGNAPRSGKRCLYIRGGAPGGHGGYWQPQVLLKPKTTYKFSAWIKVKDIKGVKVRTLHVSSPVGHIGPTIRGDQDWTLMETTFTTPDAPSISVTVYPAMLTNEGEVWIDDMSLNAADSQENLLKNPGLEIPYGTSPKWWNYPASREFSWTKYPPVKDFLTSHAAASEPGNSSITP